MNKFKTLLLFLFGGGIVGALVGTLLGRSTIPWYYSPGHGMTVQAQFPETAVAILSDLIRFQLIGMAIGAVGFLILGALVVRGRGRKGTPAEPPPSAGKP